MATRPRRVIALTLVVVLTVWVWGLVAALYLVRWNSLERPGLPAKDAFPYGEFRVGVDASNPPFAVATSDDLYGLDIDLARALGERLDIPVRFVNLGYDGLYDALKVDQVDALISALLIDPAKREEVNYSLPYYNAGLVLVSDADSPFVDMSAMPGHSVAYEFGSNPDAEARRWLRRVLPFETRPYELNDYALDAVRLGEADAALVDGISARLYLREHPTWAAQYHHVTDVWYAVGVRKDRGLAWEAINHALAGLVEDGTVAAIIDKWL
jgi:ABC-type amino acid transport substrate-binding protein